MTFEVFEAKDVKIEFEKNRLRFSAIHGESDQKYELDVELFGEIKPEVNYHYIEMIC